MTNELLAQAPAEESKTTRLKQLAVAANDAHGRVLEAARHALLHSFAAGTALVQARNLCEPRGWLGWLALNFKGSPRTAQRYMAFALDCHALEGSQAARIAEMSPDEANRRLRQLLAERNTKKSGNPHVSQRRNALPGSTANARPTGVVVRRLSEIDALCAATDSTDNPYLRVRQLLDEVMELLERIKNGEDSFDGPFAELALMDLKPVHTNLIEYLEDRDELRRIRERQAATRKR